MPLSTILGIQLVNGRIRPKFGPFATFVKALFFLGSFALFLYLFYVGIVENFEYVIISLVSIAALVYVALITPEFQNPKNYSIKLKDPNSLEGLELYYKEKLVKINYKIDEEGKIAFVDNKNKTKHISYASEEGMSRFEKFKIINFFIKWLHDNNLLSKEVKASFE